MGAYLEFATNTERHGFTRVNAATKAQRPYIVRGKDLSLKGFAADPTDITSTSSGSSPVDIVRIPSPFDESTEFYPPDNCLIMPIKGSERFEAVPSAAGDRLLESPTDGSLAGPATERFAVEAGLGISFLPVVNDDITGL